MICQVCAKKADDISSHARYFREKAEETRITYYVKVMNETAETLEALSRYFAERCRCGEAPEKLDAAIGRRRHDWESPPAGRPLASAA